MTARLRVGLMGGTFDPIHLGHVDLALACLRELSLDQVWLLPARVPPHKPSPEASAFHRHAMVALAATADARLVPDPRELARDGASYTIDTLEEVGRERADLDIHLLIGADSLRDLPTWRRWRDIVAAVVIVATGRAGVDLDAVLAQRAKDLPADRLRVVRHVPPPWSSRDLRRRLHAADACSDALDPLVRSYIARCGLYSVAPSIA